MKDEFGTPERVEWHLSNWREWMRHPELHLDYPSKALGFATGGQFTHIEDWEAQVDAWVARTMDALINDLAPIEQAAIYHRYLFSVYRFPREPHYIVLERAKRHIGVGLRHWGIL
jgi:hypothetical protein